MDCFNCGGLGCSCCETPEGVETQVKCSISTTDLPPTTRDLWAMAVFATHNEAALELLGLKAAIEISYKVADWAMEARVKK